MNFPKSLTIFREPYSNFFVIQYYCYNYIKLNPISKYLYYICNLYSIVINHNLVMRFTLCYI